ncbi:MAG: P-loop NTPase [Thermoplasmata archaeon]|nr:P-loop NTPase [Thermoplasmata archaeon]MBE3140506.1 P-loop NTPase [Thermoplasmata archaeon]
MEPRTSVIEKRLKNIKRIIAVASGKGGVGKSLVASSLALHLAHNGHKVGLLDLDLYGPSSHIILGIKDEFPAEEKGIIPPTVHGISFMSIVYFTQEKPSPFRGVDISNIILELLAITQWGSLDFLIIDMPPGIGDETLDVIRYMKTSEFLVVTTPSKVAMGAVSKLLKILIELKKPVLGVIENMTMTDSSFIKQEVKKLNVRYLGKIHFDETLEEAIGNADRLAETQAMKNLTVILMEINL